MAEEPEADNDETVALTSEEIAAAQLDGEEKPAPIYPLGLPKGSVRALTALLIFVTTCLLILSGEKVPVELRMTLVLTLSYYFASRPKMRSQQPAPKRKEASPLWLPRGSMRLLFIAGFSAMVFFLVRKEGSVTDTVGLDNLATMALIGAFLFGSLLRPVLDKVLKVFGERATAVVLGGHIRGMIALGCTVLYALAVWFKQLSELPAEAPLAFLFVVGFYFGNRN